MTLTVNKILIYKFGQCYMYLNISNEHMLVPSFTTNCKTYYKFCMDLSMQLLRQRAFSSIDPRRLEKKNEFFFSCQKYDSWHLSGTDNFLDVKSLLYRRGDLFAVVLRIPYYCLRNKKCFRCTQFGLRVYLFVLQ